MGEMCSIITKQTGFDYSATIKPSLVTTREPDTYSFIQNKDFEGLNINLDTDFYIPVSVAEKYPKIILDRPSLLISISGRIGNIALYTIEEKAFIGGAVGICKLKDVDAGKTAMYELMSLEGQKYFASLIKASSHANITVEDIRNIEVLIPRDKMEIIKLNEFIDNLSKLITLHQRKCDETKKLKKFMLQKMFPKNGEKNPEIRFAGFTDDWEQRKLLDCIQKITDFRGRTPKKLGMDWSERGYLALSALNVKDGYIDFSQDVHYGDQSLYEKWMTGNELHKGQVLFTTEAPMGNVAQVPDNRPYILSQRTLAFEVNIDLITEDFLATILRTPSVITTLTALSSGGTAKGVSQKTLATVKITIPANLYEQEKLSNMFSEINHLITLHQRK